MAPSQASHTPSLATWTKSLRDQSLEASIESLIFLLKRRQVTGDECAGAIAQLLRQVVAKSKWHDVDQLLYRVQTAGARLARAAPHEPVIGNIVRRVLGLIRDEASENRNADDIASDAASDIQSKSMFNLLSVADPSESPVTGASTPISQAQQPFSVHALRSEVMDGIEEILDEINQADDQIASFAEIQIHPGDYVLAYQPSKTVERFLVKAASKRRFTVILASLNPPAPGEEEQPYAALRKKLNAAGVSTINLASNGLMAYIPRVNKVIFGAKAVYQNGGLLVDSGACIAAQAAHEYLKPVIALCGVYKFCPEDPSDEVSRGELGNPSSYVSYADGPELDSFEVENTTTDYIPPDLVDVYLTNLGPQTRHHLGGIYADHYKIEDIGFSLQVGE
uniref:Translation initiation factor eIF2b-like protein,Translation initiation factor eIF2b-like protein n=1 Tax=Thermochaetoides thermophila TaxID=209285 RepID=UPI0006BB99F5|nr:Chain A, Translation initiation factor eIF2b-like protein,Translation initiation factor eIF2b-like protein [Thermochaetoides thermophila]4ZEM_B Chain B, Translation initiation factor eIF2b-like protein,Translation initiation factor eIF2b-like protein [Thermochaetoides thermophila]